MEDGTRSGAQEQEYLFQLNGKFNELQENEGEEEETRVNQPPVSEPHTKRAFLPFRSWCAECAARRRDNPPHRRVPKDEYAEPEILMDYCFVRRDNETETVTIFKHGSSSDRAPISIPPMSLNEA